MLHNGNFGGDPLTSLPGESMSLVGRAIELASLEDLAGRRPLVTLTGPGGIGKSRLAVALVHVLHERGFRVGFVELADVSSPSAVLDAIANQIDLELVPGAVLEEGLMRFLGATPTVLVLDNFEQVLGASGYVEELIEQCPNLHLVLTSRRALGVEHEHVFTVGPLAARADDNNRSAAGVQLLLERSDVTAPRAAELDAAERIVAGLGGLPLAIELAASRARALGISAVQELLIDDLSLDAFGTGNDGRHGGLRDCLEWTYRDLDDRALAVFHATGAFAGSFDLPALAAVVGDRRRAATGLATLLEHHFVERLEDDESARYSLLPPIREFARERLAADSAAATIVDRHVAYYTAVAANIGETFERESGAAAFDEYRRELANTGAAVQHCFSAGRFADAARIGCHLAKISGEAGREGRVTSWFARLASAARVANVELPFEAQVWVAYGNVARRTPPTAGPALRALEEVYERAKAAGDDRAVLRALDRIAFSLSAHGDALRAYTAVEEGRALAEQLGLRRTLAQFLLWSAMLLHVAGDLRRAEELGLAALDLARDLGDSRLVVRVGLLFAPMPVTPRIEAAAVPSLAACMEAARVAGSTIDEMYVVMQLAVRAGFAKDPAAFDLALRGLVLADRTRSHTAELVFVLALAGAAFDAGDDKEATRLHAGLHAEWSVVRTVIPAPAMEQYETIVERRRAAAGASLDRAIAAAAAVAWPDVLATAREYAQRRVESRSAPVLTERELDVLRHVAAGHTNKEIALLLGLRPKTVMHHTGTIYRKLGVRTRTEAAARALQDGLVELELGREMPGA